MLSRSTRLLRRHHLGLVALFIALGGTSYAAVIPSPNSVRSKHIRNGQVKGGDIARNAVRAKHIAKGAINSDDIQDGSIKAADIDLDSLPKLTGTPGPTGPVGPAGAAGKDGERGPTGATGPAGSADTPQEVLDKLKTVDGAGSGLDADLLGGLPVTDFQKRVTGTCGAAQYLQTVAADGTVTCGTDAGGDITAVVAGNGLTGGATSGSATLGIAVPLTLTQSNTSNTSPVVDLVHQGQGTVLRMNQSNASAGGVVLDMAHAGPGHGLISNAGGNAVWGLTRSISNAAVIGDSGSGEAIVARQTGAICDNNISFCNGIGAVVGRHDGRGGYGVRGFVTDPNGAIGVLGQAGISGGTGVAVRGENVNANNGGNAIEGATNGSGAAIQGTGTLAGRFNGNVQINGNLTVTGTKSGFQIDDPADPANRTLSHTPIETDAFTVQYSGNVTTGRDGRATVRLPAYATQLAGAWRYALTPIGRFGQAIVEREVRGGAFVVRTEHPRTKVSWTVTGTRQDPYARANPFRVIAEKARAVKGRYLHQEEYGKPASLSAVPPLRLSAQSSAPLASDQPARTR